MDKDSAVATSVRGRWAVAAIFLVNGFLTGSWAPQIPVFAARLEIGEGTLGLLILLFGAGAVGSMSWCGYLISRYGSQNVVRWFGAAGTLGLLAVALAPGIASAAFAMIAFGGLIGGMDVAMNANAVIVERRLGRAIMSSSHGFWSLGGFIGGGLGGLAIERFGHLGHAAGATAAAVAIAGVALWYIVPDGRPPAGGERNRRIALPASAGIYLIGLMALFCMIPEGAVLDWAAIYLRQEMDADLATAGFAFAGFSGTMAAMRFLGDRVRNRFGAVATMRASALIAACGLLAGGLSPEPWMAVAAFAFCGLGIANMVPIVFSAAGNQKDLSPGAGMAVVTTMGYSGILMAPSAIGFVAESIGFAPVFITLSGLLLVVFLMAPLAKGADFDGTR